MSKQAQPCMWPCLKTMWRLAALYQVEPPLSPLSKRGQRGSDCIARDHREE